MTVILATLLIALHFLYHVIAATSVIYSLWHSNKVHKRSAWKLGLALLWLVLSLIVLVPELLHRHEHCT